MHKIFPELTIPLITFYNLVCNKGVNNRKPQFLIRLGPKAQAAQLGLVLNGRGENNVAEGMSVMKNSSHYTG